MTWDRGYVAAVFAVATLLLAACGGGEPTAPGGNGGNGGASVASVEVTPAADTLAAIGAAVELSARALDDGGGEVPGVSFTWSSSDEAAVTVDGTGVAEAVAEGEAEVTATAEGVSGAAEVAVVQEVAAVAVSPSSATLTAVGDTTTFTAATEDANGHAVEGVDLTWASSDTTVATVDPDGLALAKKQGEAAITATASEVALAGEADLSVDPSIDGLTFGTEPTGATAGEAFAPSVRVAVVDRFGNPVEDADVTVTVSLVGGDPGATLQGTTTAQTTAGVATFDDLRIERAASNYRLEASAGGALTGVTSRSFDVSPADLSDVVLTEQPSDVTAGQRVRPDVQAVLRDPFGNVLVGAEDPVSIQIVDGPGGAGVSGTPSVVPTSGVATFDDLRFETAGTYTVRATSSGVPSAPSEPFEVSHAGAVQLVYQTPPGTTEGQVSFDPPVVVEVLDNFGNRATESTVDVTLSVVDVPAGVDADLRGTTTVSASDGFARFDDVWLAPPGDGYTLRATSGTRIPATSDPFSVELTFAELSGGRTHTCGLTEPGYLYCWGDNSHGQLGDETTDASLRPVPVSEWGGGTGRQVFHAVEAGAVHTCGRSPGGILCWGWNEYGQLGNGTVDDHLAPRDISSAVPMESVSAGRLHSCSVATDGGVHCWGLNSSGQLGDGTTQDRWVPAEASSSATFTRVSASNGSHTCALSTHDDANVFCWGWGEYGQLGDGTTDRTTPHRVQEIVTHIDLSVGQDHTCTATAGGLIVCWGRNHTGQLGDNTTTDRAEPASLYGAGGLVFRKVAAGDVHSCGLTEDGAAHCWGSNLYGQVGDGTTTQRNVVTPVHGGLPFTSLTAGGHHTCGVTAEGEAYCWGYNEDGQLGDGTTIGRHTPTRVRP